MQHYHVVPVCLTNAPFGVAQGWDLSNHAWSTVAPNGQHSPQIGWAFDGYPIFGPYARPAIRSCTPALEPVKTARRAQPQIGFVSDGLPIFGE